MRPQKHVLPSVYTYLVAYLVPITMFHCNQNPRRNQQTCIPFCLHSIFGSMNSYHVKDACIFWPKRWWLTGQVAQLINYYSYRTQYRKIPFCFHNIISNNTYDRPRLSLLFFFSLKICFGVR